MHFNACSHAQRSFVTKTPKMIHADAALRSPPIVLTCSCEHYPGKERSGSFHCRARGADSTQDLPGYCPATSGPGRQD
jgi:hypothetical protein